MSGRKVSAIRLAEALKRREECARRVARMQRQCGALLHEVRNRLDTAPAGLRLRFSQASVAAANLLKDLEPNAGLFSIPELDNEENLLRQERAVAAALARASAVADSLRNAFMDKADELERQLSARIHGVAGRLSSANQLLERWQLGLQKRELEVRIEPLAGELAAREFDHTERALVAAEKDVDVLIAACEKQEAANRRRLYAAESLKQVCMERGYRVKDEQFERAGDDTSRMAVIIDTYSGEWRFVFAVDEIQLLMTDAESHCLEDVKALAERLSQRFGVNTEFVQQGPPLRRRKGELEEPGGAQRDRGASS